MPSEARVGEVNGRVYDPLTAQFLSPDNYIQSAGDWLNFNRYSYCLNNPFKYTDPSGQAFGVDDAIIILAMAYMGGLQANFFNSNNPFNPATWNWRSANTYIGILGGGISGASIIGISIPQLQVPGIIPNGLLHSGIQVTLNGIGNLTEKKNFFDNWYWSAVMGFTGGAFAGYRLAKEKGMNFWWGNDIKYGRKQWSFFNVEKPFQRVDFDISNVGSKNLNDCVPTSFAEIDDYFGGNTSYEDYVKITNYQQDVGVMAPKEPDAYGRFLYKQFTGTPMSDPVSVLADPQQVLSIKESGSLIHTNMPHSGIRHADNLRSIKYYHSGKVVMRFRIGSYRLSSVNDNWWFYILNGIR